MSALNAGLETFDESAAFFFGDRCRDIGDQFPGAVGADLFDPAIGDRYGGPSILTALEETLIDAAGACKPRDLPDDVLVLAGLDSVDERTELLTAGIGAGVAEVGVAVDVVVEAG